jgi:alpha-1,2-mannosyltransferase
MAVLLVVLSLLLIAAVDVLFFSHILRFFAGLVGRHLRRCSRTRRELLLARVANETRNFEASGKTRTKHGHGLEDVAPAPAPSGSEWKGIVGFFHPFWCVAPCKPTWP